MAKPKFVTGKNLTINWLPDPKNAETNGGNAKFQLDEGNEFFGEDIVDHE